MDVTLNNTRGFTLIEILISIGVFGMIRGLAIGIFLSLSAAYDRADVVSTLNSEGNRVIEIVSRMVKSSSNVTEQVTPAGLILILPTESLEYETNGRCHTVVIEDDGTGGIEKYSTASDCIGTPICPSTAPCLLTSSKVTVQSFSTTVVEGGLNPDQVSISYELTQDASLSDTSQQGAIEFARTISSRSY